MKVKLVEIDKRPVNTGCRESAGRTLQKEEASKGPTVARKCFMDLFWDFRVHGKY